jgi:hypothetical protein
VLALRGEVQRIAGRGEGRVCEWEGRDASTAGDRAAVSSGARRRRLCCKLLIGGGREGAVELERRGGLVCLREAHVVRVHQVDAVAVGEGRELVHVEFPQSVRPRRRHEGAVAREVQQCGAPQCIACVQSTAHSDRHMCVCVCVCGYVQKISQCARLTKVRTSGLASLRDGCTSPSRPSTVRPRGKGYWPIVALTRAAEPSSCGRVGAALNWSYCCSRAQRTQST